MRTYQQTVATKDNSTKVYIAQLRKLMDNAYKAYRANPCASTYDVLDACTLKYQYAYKTYA